MLFELNFTSLPHILSNEVCNMKAKVKVKSKGKVPVYTLWSGRGSVGIGSHVIISALGGFKYSVSQNSQFVNGKNPAANRVGDWMGQSRSWTLGRREKTLVRASNGTSIFGRPVHAASHYADWAEEVPCKVCTFAVLLCGFFTQRSAVWICFDSLTARIIVLILVGKCSRRWADGISYKAALGRTESTVDGRIILKLVIKKGCVSVWAGFN
jgi:hypothetical protein